MYRINPPESIGAGGPRAPGQPDTARRSAYSFQLPPERIAQEPAPRREDARLMVLPRRQGAIQHRSFRDLPDLLQPGDLLVVNDTRVIPARVAFRRRSGGVVPGLLLDVPSPAGFRMLLQGSARLRPGERLEIAEGSGVVLERALGDGAWQVRPDPPQSAAAVLAAGRMPLPPYIRRAKAAADPRDAIDRERYQTVFASKPGAVAAPTAGLHFTPDLLGAATARGVEIARVTLHVGPGTFLPVRVDDLAEHRMHPEHYAVPEATAAALDRTRRRGGRVIAVGTTVVRTLESAWDGRSGRLVAGSAVTDIFIRPPFVFRAVDAMITNFHLPESTLLMLVAAFAGRERILDAYRVAVDQGYRFFSYGDAMLIAGEAERTHD